MTIWHPNTQMSEWDKFDNIVRGDGMWLVDEHGHRMLDAVASMWCIVWGHSEPELVSALIRQASRAQHTPLFNLTHPSAERLAGYMQKMCPGMEGVFYSDNGSTAMEAAFKMAIQFWNNQGVADRCEIAGLEGGYHGDTLGSMAAGYSQGFFGRYRGAIPKCLQLRIPTAGSQPEEWEECLQDAAAVLEGSRNVAALALESGAQVAGGARIYPPKFQSRLINICRNNDILVIADEVATGFGRLGAMAEYSRQGTAPDIVSYGKMITGGYLPMAATLATARIQEEFLGAYQEGRHLFHGHTYTGNPLAAAVACRNMELYEERQLLNHVQRVSTTLGEELRAAEEMRLVMEVRHHAMLAGIQLDLEPPQDRSANHMLYHAGRKNGVYLRALGSTILVVPPLAINEDQIRQMVSGILDTIRDVTL